MKKRELSLYFIIFLSLLCFASLISAAAIAPPTKVNAASISSSSIRISWNDSLNETGYKIERSVTSSSGFSQVGSVGENTTEYSDSGLQSNKTYFYKIRETHPYGDSGYSIVVNATTWTSAGGGGSVKTSNLDNDNVGKAYKCLENQIANKSTLSFQEAIFTTLALGSRTNAVDKIERDKGNNCWPKGGCNLKDTALATLAYRRIGKNTSAYETWMINRNITIQGLNWYLEIGTENQIASKCTVTYGSNVDEFNILSNMKLSGSASSCLSVDTTGYWLAIQENCLKEEFKISCDQNFMTTLLYKKTNGETIFVSPITTSSSSLGETREKINSLCLRGESGCDYEGTLWAAAALTNTNLINSLIPYLVALAPDNTQYLPSAFLYSLTSNNDQYTELVQSQKQSQYWEVSNNRFYDTAVALMGLQKVAMINSDRRSSSNEVTRAKEYLMKPTVQTQQGCWNNNNIRDTAFLLYAGWYQEITSSGSSGGSGGITPPPPVVRDCESGGYFCETALTCTGPEVSGTLKTEFSCPGILKCCSKKATLPSCRELEGVICSITQDCVGTDLPSIDESCCKGSCKEKATPPVTDECLLDNGACRDECGDNEEIGAKPCADTAKKCCVEKISTVGPRGFPWGIAILIILIIVVIVAIIFRDKLRVYYYKFSKKGPATPGSQKPGNMPPRYPPAGMQPAIRPPQRPPQFNTSFGPRSPPPVMQKRTAPLSQRDKEMEETLRKLKEMSS